MFEGSQATGASAQLQIDRFQEPARGLGSLRMALERVPAHEAAVLELEKLVEHEDLFEEVSEILESVYRARGLTDRLAKLYEKRVGFADSPYANAELVGVPLEKLIRLPDAIGFDVAAAVLLQGLTAHYLVTSTYHLQRGESCLVHAAAGGVGLLLCQMARRIGARVIGTVSTEEKAQLAREAGADDVILYTQADFETEVKRLTAGAGVQVVYDSVGRTTFAKGLNCLARRGLMVLLGQSSGPVEPVDPQILNQKGSLFLTRPTIGHYTATREELLQRSADVLGWVADGSLSVRIGHEFPLARAADAHRDLEGRRTTGKVLLVP